MENFVYDINKYNNISSQTNDCTSFVFSVDAVSYRLQTNMCGLLDFLYDSNELQQKRTPFI